MFPTERSFLFACCCLCLCARLNAGRATPPYLAARDFYSKPSTVRYQLSGMERLRILRGQNQNPDEDYEDMPIGPIQDQEDSSEDETNAIWNQAVISSITFRKSPEQEN